MLHLSQYRADSLGVQKHWSSLSGVADTGGHARNRDRDTPPPMSLAMIESLAGSGHHVSGCIGRQNNRVAV